MGKQHRRKNQRHTTIVNKQKIINQEIQKIETPQIETEKIPEIEIKIEKIPEIQNNDAVVIINQQKVTIAENYIDTLTPIVDDVVNDTVVEQPITTSVCTIF